MAGHQRVDGATVTIQSDLRSIADEGGTNADFLRKAASHIDALHNERNAAIKMIHERDYRIEALENALREIDNRLEFFNDRSWTLRPGLILKRVVEVTRIAREALEGSDG
jgi:hypothetical protein